MKDIIKGALFLCSIDILFNEGHVTREVINFFKIRAKNLKKSQHQKKNLIYVLGVKMEQIRKSFCALLKKRYPLNVLPCFIGDISCNMKQCKVRMANSIEIRQLELLRSQDLEKELKQIEAEIAAEQTTRKTEYTLQESHP